MWRQESGAAPTITVRSARASRETESCWARGSVADIAITMGSVNTAGPTVRSGSRMGSHGSIASSSPARNGPKGSAKVRTRAPLSGRRSARASNRGRRTAKLEIDPHQHRTKTASSSRTDRTCPFSLNLLILCDRARRSEVSSAMLRAGGVRAQGWSWTLACRSSAPTAPRVVKVST